MTAARFIEAYRGKPPWDIGRPQPAFEELAEAGEIFRPVLDVGCGTGENALFLAARGFEVVGVDAVQAAVEAARRKGIARGLPASSSSTMPSPSKGSVGVSPRSWIPVCSTPSTTASAGAS